MTAQSQPTTLLNAVTATGASRAIGSDGGPLFMQVSGITTATVALQGSLDGTTFVTIGSALTADGMITLANAPKYVRANVTAYTSGTITVKVMN